VDREAEVNHHITAFNYTGYSTGIHTLLITHVDNAVKLRKITTALETARAAICMSSETAMNLAAMGVRRDRLTYAHMAHDGKAQEKQFVIGFTTRLYPDGRKRERDVVKLMNHISPNDFRFKIMGFGWAPIVDQLRQRGFMVEYHEDFDYEKYIGLMATLDYFVYLGRDEGAAAFIDALAAGVKTIVEPQGFHLDAWGGITHAVKDFEELRKVFLDIAADKRSRIDAVRTWTWHNYAIQHLAIWRACLDGTELPLSPRNGKDCPQPVSAVRWRLRLWRNYFTQRARMVLNLRRDYDCSSRFWSRRNKQDRK
jgi:hypothetical protein